MAPYLWAALAGVTATGMEFLFRRGIDWLGSWWWVLPGALVINYSIYRLLSADYGWMPSIVLFGAMTALLRVGLAFLVLREPLSVGNIAATVVLFLAVGIRLVWR